MATQYTYFLILAASIAGPFLLSFDKKVAFYSKWKFLFPAMLLPALFYLIWDSLFTSMGVWSFNPHYITGIKIGNLPVEEVLFFVVVPYCSLFIYECVRCYFPNLQQWPMGNILLKVLAVALFITAIIFYNRWYTAVTFLLNAIFITWLLYKPRLFSGFDATSFFIAYAIILVPFLIVNGFLTAIPVVLYNNAENLGFRIYTIPFEDIFYGMLLLMLMVAGYEKRKLNKTINKKENTPVTHLQKIEAKLM
jgi:lycopene cyclase domain-containing protein